MFRVRGHSAKKTKKRLHVEFMLNLITQKAHEIRFKYHNQKKMNPHFVFELFSSNI